MNEKTAINNNSLNLRRELIENLTALGFYSLTDIQEKTLPDILLGKDVIAQAKTGSGKTAAFALGVLQSLKVDMFRVQALVLCPTRELADQVAKEIRRLARAIHNIKVLTLCGGSPIGPQIGSLEHGAHIIVGTPGRVSDHLRKGRLVLDHLSTLVLDEADRMLDMGFQDTIDDIVEHAPSARQTLLFSATYPPEIRNLSRRVMRNAIEISATPSHSPKSISESFYKVAKEEQRFHALRYLLHDDIPESCMVFCETKKETQSIADQLMALGFAVLALHGDLDQKDRERTLVRFANGSANVLVATDVAARGLDIADVSLVINYRIARDPEVHTHRIGRTGRAGQVGKAYTIFTERDAHKLAFLRSDVDPITDAHTIPDKSIVSFELPKIQMTTLEIDGGKKQKLRPADILGALTASPKIDGAQVGKIDMFPMRAYVAVDRRISSDALSILKDRKMKGRSFKVRLIRC